MNPSQKYLSSFEYGGVSNFHLLFINFEDTLISSLRRIYESLDTPTDGENL
jgi:hypothetical protein